MTMTNYIPNNGHSRTSSETRPVRVGYVVKRYPRFSETFIVNEILSHEAAGWEIDIFSLRPCLDTHFQHAIADVRATVTQLRHGGIRVEALWKELESYGKDNPQLWSVLPQATDYSAVEVFQAILLAREIQSRGIEHLHAHFATTATAVARLASLLTGISYTLTAHAKDIFHESVDESLLDRRLTSAAKVITVSDFNVRDLSGRFPHAAKNIRRIYNGLDLSSYCYCDPRKRAPKIVAVGRLVEKKGFGDLIEACAILAESDLDFQCEIIGGGDYEKKLQTKIEELGLQERVALLGPLPQREAHRAIQDATVCAAPCVTASTGDRDGLPTVLIEAMALGTPCVSTDVTGIAEIVRHRETGLVVSEQQPVQLAEAMRALLQDADLRITLSRAARRLVEQQFDIHTNTMEQRKLFSQSCRVPSSENIPQPTLAEVG